MGILLSNISHSQGSDGNEKIEFANKKNLRKEGTVDIMMLFISCKKTGAARKLEQA